MSEFVKETTEQRIATITLTRPDVHNAFNEVVIAELTEAFAELGENPEVRVIVLASGGKSFSAGADINWMKRMVGYSVEENIADATKMAPVPAPLAIVSLRLITLASPLPIRSSTIACSITLITTNSAAKKPSRSQSTAW